MSDATIKIMDRLQDNFTMIPNEICHDPRVTPEAARLYMYLACEGGGDPASVDDAAHYTGMQRGTILTAIADLKNLGYVKEGDE